MQGRGGLVFHYSSVHHHCMGGRIETNSFKLQESGRLGSLGLNEDVVVVGRHSPVLTVVVFIGIVLLVVGEEGVELEALFEVLGGLEASDVFEHVEVAVGVDTRFDQSVPVHALQTNVRIVLLKAEVHCGMEANVRALDRVHVVTRHLELAEVKVLGEHLHLNLLL